MLREIILVVASFHCVCAATTDPTEEIYSAMYTKRLVSLRDMIVESESDPITSVLDVGANTGTWSKMIHGVFPEVP